MSSNTSQSKEPKISRNLKNFALMSDTAQSCFVQLTSIYEDCAEYNNFLNEGIKGKKDPIQYLKSKDKTSKDIFDDDIDIPEFRNIIKAHSSHVTSKNNLYNSLTLYMWNTFEKNMFDLIRTSYKTNKNFKHRYITRFRAVDKKLLSQKPHGKKQGSPKGLMGTEYLTASKKKQDSINLENINQVVAHNGTLDSYHYLFDDGKWQTEEGERIYNNFLEIKARRNLLVHRGDTIDKTYLDHSRAEGKPNGFKDKEIIAKFYERRFFQAQNNKSTGKRGKEIEIGDKANCTYGYVAHVYFTLAALYCHYWCEVIRDFVGRDDKISCSSLVHGLMESSLKIDGYAPLTVSRFITHSFFSIYNENKCIDKINPIDRINDLLIFKNLSDKNKASLEKRKSYIYLSESNSLDRVFKMALAFIRDDLEEGFNFLESTSEEEVGEVDMHSWYLFNGLRNKKRFKEIYKKKFNKAFKAS